MYTVLSVTFFMIQLIHEVCLIFVNELCLIFVRELCLIFLREMCLILYVNYV